MAGDTVQEAAERNKEDAIDRLSHCSLKVAALSDLHFGDLSYKGAEGISFLLRDLKDELEDIEKEIRFELHK